MFSTASVGCYVTGMTAVPGTVPVSQAQSVLMRRDPAEELLLCSRYFYQKASGEDFLAGSRAGNSNDNASIFHPVPMRTTPSFTAVWDDATAGSIVRQGPRNLWLQSTNAAAGHYITSFKASARL